MTEAIGYLAILVGQLLGRVPSRLQALAETGEALAYPGDGSRVSGNKTLERKRLVRPNTQDTQAVMMQEGKAGMASRELLPVPPSAEVALADVDVVQQDHSARRQLRPPSLEVVPNGVQGVIAVEVQQVDRPVGEMGQRVVESGADQARETCIMPIVVRAKLGEYIVAVKAGLRIAQPGVHGVGGGLELQFRDGLAERGIGRAIVGAELDQHPRPVRVDQPEGERDVPEPSRLHQPVRHRERDRPDEVAETAISRTRRLRQASEAGRTLVIAAAHDHFLLPRKGFAQHTREHQTPVGRSWQSHVLLAAVRVGRDRREAGAVVWSRPRR